MTPEEAFWKLEDLSGEIYDQVYYDYNAHEFSEEEYEALELAIKALKEMEEKTK